VLTALAAQENRAYGGYFASALIDRAAQFTDSEGWDRLSNDVVAKGT